MKTYENLRRPTTSFSRFNTLGQVCNMFTEPVLKEIRRRKNLWKLAMCSGTWTRNDALMRTEQQSGTTYTTSLQCYRNLPQNGCQLVARLFNCDWLYLVNRKSLLTVVVNKICRRSGTCTVTVFSVINAPRVLHFFEVGVGFIIVHFDSLGIINFSA